MDTFENILRAFEEKIQFKDNRMGEECDMQQLASLQDLSNFEEQLQESQFRHKVI